MKKQTKQAFAIIGLTLLYIQALLLLNGVLSHVRYGFSWWTDAVFLLLFVTFIYTPEITVALSLSKKAAKKQQKSYASWLIFPVAMIPASLWVALYSNANLLSLFNGHIATLDVEILLVIALLTIYAIWQIVRLVRNKSVF